MNSRLRKFKEFNFLNTEYTGIDSNGIYKPKSLEHIIGNAYSYCLKGICESWTTLSDKPGLFSSGPVNSETDENKEFIEFLLYFWLTEFNLLLSSNVLPEFIRTKKDIKYLKGQVDFNFFELNSFKSEIDFRCKYSELTFDLPELRVIKDGYIQIVKSINNFSFMSQAIFEKVSLGLQLLKQIPQSSSPIGNAISVQYKLQLYKDNSSNEIYMPSKLRSLGQLIDFFSRYITSGLNGVKGQHAGFDGFLFNLNDLFELILKKSLQSLYIGSKEEAYFPKGSINSISVNKLSGPASKKNMDPDCLGIFDNIKEKYKGLFSEFFEGKIYVIDAKHKLYFKDGELEDIDRSDFYQIISYGRTHVNPDSLEGIYSLVGIQEERSIIEDNNFALREYILNGDKLPGSVVKIQFDNNTFEIFQVSLKFAQIVYDLAVCSEDEKDIVFERVGECLLRAYKQMASKLEVIK